MWPKPANQRQNYVESAISKFVLAPVQSHSGNVPTPMEIIVLLRMPFTQFCHFKIHKGQNLSYSQAVCRRTIKEEIEAFKASIKSVQQSAKIITTTLWEINIDDFKTIEQLDVVSMGELLSLCLMTSNSISLTRAP